MAAVRSSVPDMMAATTETRGPPRGPVTSGTGSERTSAAVASSFPSGSSDASSGGHSAPCATPSGRSAPLMSAVARASASSARTTRGSSSLPSLL